MDKLIKKLETVHDNDVTIYKSLVKIDDTTIDIVNSRIITPQGMRSASCEIVKAACIIYLRKRSKNAGLHDYCVNKITHKCKKPNYKNII